MDAPNLLSEIRHHSLAKQEQMLWAVLEALEALDDEFNCGNRPARTIKKEINILLAALRDVLNRKGTRICVVEMKIV